MRLGRQNEFLFSVSFKLKTFGCLEMVDVTVLGTVLNMELSNKIVDFQIVQVSEVTSSNAMKREGYKRCIEIIHNRGAIVK